MSRSGCQIPTWGSASFDDNSWHHKLEGSGQCYNKYDHLAPTEFNASFSQITHCKNADWSLGLDRRGWHYPCLSPLSVLGVAFSSTARAQAFVFQAAVRCLRLEGLLKPNTGHYSFSLPPSLPSSSPLPFPLGSSPPPSPMLPFRNSAQLLSLCTVTIAIYSQQLAL